MLPLFIPFSCLPVASLRQHCWLAKAYAQTERDQECADRLGKGSVGEENTGKIIMAFSKG